MSFIEAKNLTFSYEDATENALPAIKDLSFSIERGEYVAVLGHNGSGKSTLAKLLNLILMPTGGSLTVADKEINEDMSEDEVFAIRRQVGMVFQNPDNQLVATTVEEDVAFGPENLGVPHEELQSRVDEALATVGMTAYAKHAPHRLSGGQKQRVAIAGIMAMKPKCIVFDESTAMLDPLGRREILDQMDKLNRDEGITVIHITHYMEEAARAQRVIVVNDGEIYMDGTPREVFSQVEALRRVGLEAPQSGELLYELRMAGIEGVSEASLGVEEAVGEILRLLDSRKGGAR